MSSHPANEPILDYAPGSPERAALQAELDRQLATVMEVPCIVNGNEVFTGNTVEQVVPHNHGHVLAKVHLAGRSEIEGACAAAVAAQADWIALGLEFDPEKVIYDELLTAFWECHDPTQLNRQGPDFGTQYRSAIFCHSKEQLSAAQASLEAAQPRFGGGIVTQIEPAQEFWRAEEYHQNYFQKNPNAACHI